nr:hypothetical protein Itr_chr13CG12580 [Ipomoea trifida]
MAMKYWKSDMKSPNSTIHYIKTFEGRGGVPSSVPGGSGACRRRTGLRSMVSLVRRSAQAAEFGRRDYCVRVRLNIGNSD